MVVIQIDRVLNWCTILSKNRKHGCEMGIINGEVHFRFNNKWHRLAEYTTDDTEVRYQMDDRFYYERLGGELPEDIDHKTISLSNAYKNTPRLAQLANEKGFVVIHQDNTPRYLLIDCEHLANGDIYPDITIAEISKTLLENYKSK